MGKFYTPSFDSIDSVFAVLADPVKTAKALGEMRAMRDAINARLGDLDTHEKVEASVAAANILIMEVQAAKQKAIEDVEAATASAAQMIDDAKAEAKAVLDAARVVEAKRKGLLAEVEGRSKKLDGFEAALGVRERINNEKADELARRSAEIVSREKEIADKAKRIADAVAG